MQLRNPWPVRIIASVTALNGLLAIAEVIALRFPRRIEALLPFNYEVLDRNAGLLAGFILLYISWRLLARKRRAWTIAYLASFVVLAGHVLYAHSIAPVLVAALSLLILSVYYNEFDVASEPVSIRQAVGLLCLSLIVALTYGTLGFYLLIQRDFGENFGLVEAIVRTLRALSLVGNSDLVPRTSHADWFLDSLTFFGAATITIGVASLFRPLTYRFNILPADRQRARSIIDRYAVDSEAGFMLWPEDKTYFFSPSRRSVLAYRVAAGSAIVLGDPVGPEDDLDPILTTFYTYAHKHGWTISYLYVTAMHVARYEALGMRSFMIGQDAIVETITFSETTIRSKHFRAVMNKYERLGYSYVLSQPPHSQAVLQALSAVSQAWLKQPGRVERGFALGYFDYAYMNRSELALIYDAQGRLEAFTNLVVSYDPKRASIDLMRYLPGGESNAMDYLLASLIIDLAARDIAELSLGLAPLAGIVAGPESDVAERIVIRLAQINIAGFSFHGLRRFKDKFKPVWEDRFLVYERNPGSLGITAYAVDKVMKRPNIDIFK